METSEAQPRRSRRPSLPRAPLAVGAALFVATLVWAAAQWKGAQARERNQLERYADSLARGLAVVADRFGTDADPDEALRVELSTHLLLEPPFVSAALVRGGTIVAEVGPRDGDARLVPAPGLSADGRRFVVRTPVTEPPPPPPGGAPPPESARRFSSPWRWATHPDEPGAGQAPPLELVVSFDPTVNPGAVKEVAQRTALGLAVAWLGIGTLVLAWLRSVRSRELRAALEEERRERERLAELGLAAAGLAHEIKNPLGLILGLAQRLEAQRELGPAVRDGATQILDAADRASARLSDFITFARMPAPVMQPVAVREALGRVVAALRADFAEARVGLELDAEDVRVECDGAMLEQLVVNLLLNSLQASSPGTATRVSLARRGGGLELAVADQGKGIAPELLPDVFRPYVTGRPDGHGLGLAIVQRIADQHGWAVAVDTAVGRGTTFRVTGLRGPGEGKTP